MNEPFKHTPDESMSESQHERLHEHNSEPVFAQDLVRPKPRKGIYMLPNLVTLAALFGGFYAIVMAMNGHFDSAAMGVFCAMILDAMDGRVARMTNTQSAFGEQMDSLSDMVSFGAAPALISYEWALKGLGAGAGSRHFCIALAQPFDWLALMSTPRWWTGVIFRACHLPRLQPF